MITVLAVLGAVLSVALLLCLTVATLVLRGRNCLSWALDEYRAGRAVALVVRPTRHKPYPFYGLFRPLRVLWRAGFHVGVLRAGHQNPMHHLTPSAEEHARYWAQGQWAALRSLWHFTGHITEGDSHDPDH